MQNCSLCGALANRQAGQLMVAQQGVARSWHTRAEMADSPHLSEDRVSSPPSPNIETTFTLSSLSFHRGKLQFALKVWTTVINNTASSCESAKVSF